MQSGLVVDSHQEKDAGGAPYYYLAPTCIESRSLGGGV